MNIRLASLLTLALLVPHTRAHAAQPFAPQAATAAPARPGILNRDQASAILPPSVFFRGQSATIQGRNSAGIRVPNGKLILATLVDTSGYSSALQQTYQAYLLTEVSLSINGKTLPAGAYGFGFVASGDIVVMDIGGHELLRSPFQKDETLARPNPLQILPGSSPNTYKLYLGRNFVTLQPTAN
jgi:hypothetical protein